ncbi:hypothetical protein ACFQY4_36280 [Catellatospora bangladeshensis]|uniref:Uncharacterized protein n=1 Tax=Catellatospora bangladeshensis TaxID=310355 RepID=A0A8J3NH73_9ACTN|nr:hypothetical protein [Catellatospora bangladeshensis]GIF81085.1 hypothetical protein Cba03nite_24340 [Catellatospora bangladeshensis]
MSHESEPPARPSARRALLLGVAGAILLIASVLGCALLLTTLWGSNAQPAASYAAASAGIR